MVGRLYSSRIAGSKLVFLDVVQDGNRVQGMLNFGKLEASGVSKDEFKKFYHVARRGDIVGKQLKEAQQPLALTTITEVTGTPMRTSRGELSVNGLSLPTILTPTIATMPLTLEDAETRAKARHADMLVNPHVVDTLRLRSHIIQFLRNFLVKDDFLEVQTPIIAEEAGGAAARPFNTFATEFSDKKLSLRIAPELWLKRLILGGMDRVFEIGPSFRNEGLDATHNPEFTTCEFYKSFANLDELMFMTESLLCGLAGHVNELNTAKSSSLKSVEVPAPPFQRIEFVPALEKAIGRTLPDLEAADAGEKLMAIYADLSIKLPDSPTLPRLLDELASINLEPSCGKPTFIIHHPACMAPLAKAFVDPTTNQLVSARAELFMQHKEIANMYEEENSPIEQRRKFVQQLQWKDAENEAIVDESYLEALTWGLPPTGGWGCGIDRLCMMMSGATRISDVQTFGSLKHVVGYGNGQQKKK